MSLNFKPYLAKGQSYKGGRVRKEGENKVYKLSSNENPIGASQKVLEVVKENAHLIFEYPEASNFELNHALKKHYNGVMEAGQFVATNGGVASIELIARGFLEPGSEFIYTAPGFLAIKDFGYRLGAKPVCVELPCDNFRLDPDLLLARISPKTAIVYLSNPNNPTGSCEPKEAIDYIVENLPSHVLLILDEVYWHFVEGDDHPLGYRYVKEKKNVICINSFSKAYGMAGLRVGYAYSTPSISNYLQHFRRPFMINMLSVKAAVAALEDKQFLNTTIDTVNEGKKYLYRCLNDLGIKYWKSQANFILVKLDLPAHVFEDFMFINGVMVRPADGLPDGGYVRISIGNKEANAALIKGLKRWKSDMIG